MPLKTWTNMETVTDTNWNQMVNDLQDYVIHTITPKNTPFTGLAGTAQLLAGTLLLRPVIGNYLCIKLQAWVASWASSPDDDGEFWFKITRAGVTEEIWNVGLIADLAATKRGIVVDLTALTDLGDITGTDADLKLYVNPKIKIRSLRVMSGASATLADYGGA